MPKPPILPLIDWRDVFASGLDWHQWLDAAEESGHRTDLLASFASFHPLPETAASIAGLRKAVHVVVIAESWCGDVRRHVPVLQKLAELNHLVQARYIAREPRVDVFARLLTNGGEAIPKAVFLSADFVETANWGPMPQASQRVIAQGKAANDVGGARRLVAALYAADPHRREVESEIVERLLIAATEAVPPTTTLSSG